MGIKILIKQDKIFVTIKFIGMFFFMMYMFTASGKRADALYNIGKKDKITEETTFYYYDYFSFKAKYHTLKTTECSKYPEKSSTKNSHILRCRQYIRLLRPHNIVKKWEEQEREKGYVSFMADASGKTAIHAHILSVKLSNPSSYKTFKNINQVTGIFKRYALNVKQYTFKNVLTGKITRLKATSNHPFYVLNRKKFIPVNQILPVDTLLSYKGQKLHILCHKNQTCGDNLNKGYPTLVYNLEVHGNHTYFVSTENILVHNCYVPLHNYQLTNKERDLLPTGYNIASYKLGISSAKAILEQAGSDHSVDKTLFVIMHGITDINSKYPLMVYHENLSVEALIETVFKANNKYFEYESICIIYCASEKPGMYREYFQALADKIKKPIIYNTRGNINYTTFFMRRTDDMSVNPRDIYNILHLFEDSINRFMKMPITSDTAASKFSESNEFLTIKPVKFFRTVYPRQRQLFSRS